MEANQHPPIPILPKWGFTSDDDEKSSSEVNGKQRMTNLLFKYLPTSILTFFFLTVPVFAQKSAAELVQGGLSVTGTDAGYKTTPLPVLIGNVIQALLTMVGVLFLVLTIYAGFLWMTAAGEKTKVESAKKILTNAVIGLILIIAAYALSSFIIETLVKASSLDSNK